MELVEFVDRNVVVDPFPPMWNSSSPSSRSSSFPHLPPYYHFLHTREVRLNSEGLMGWGVQAVNTIPKDTFIGFIFGELISRPRMQFRNNNNRVFNLIWRNEEADSYFEYYLDVTYFSNLLGFCNHSCSPNAIAKLMEHNHEPIITLISKKHIRAHEFIHFDYYPYAKDIHNEFPNGCYCGSPVCRAPARFVPIQ